LRAHVKKITEENKLLQVVASSQDDKRAGLICPICDNEADFVIDPCGHILCRDCNKDWFKEKAKGTCPFCRRQVSKTIKVFVG